MAIDGVDHRRARRALALISSDSGAREIFLAVYSGQEDALVLLRRAAMEEPPAVPEELNELHRQAFSRAHTPAEEHGARAALVALTAAHSRQAADSDTLHAAIIKVEEWATRHASAEAPLSAGLLPRQAVTTSIEPASEPRRLTLRPLALAIVVVVSMLIGALVVAVWANSVSNDSTPKGSPASSSPASSASPTQSVTEVVQGADAVDFGSIVSTDQGSYLAAAQWFQRTATSSDVFPSADLINGLTASSTRLVGGTPAKLKVWVGKTDDDRVCLIMTVPSTQDVLESVNSCANAQQFDALGLGLHAGGYQVIWKGKIISVFTNLTPSD